MTLIDSNIIVNKICYKDNLFLKKIQITRISLFIIVEI